MRTRRRCFMDGSRSTGQSVMTRSLSALLRASVLLPTSLWLELVIWRRERRAEMRPSMDLGSREGEW